MSALTPTILPLLPSARALREAFERVEERLARVEVKPNSALVTKKLGELELAAKIGVDVIAIRRGKVEWIMEWIINPKREEKIDSGDVLIARGAPSGIEELKKLSEGVIEELK